MLKKTPLTWLIAGLVTALAIIISGCSTEKPWTTNPNVPLTLSLVSGPADSLEVAANTDVSFSWKATGGVGELQYRHRLNEGDWSQPSNATLATLGHLPEGVYTFAVQATDAANNTAGISSVFRVVASVPETPDSLPPTVIIVEAPEESSFVAVGSPVAFSWEGMDSLGTDEGLLYQYTFAGVTSDWTATRTVTFAGVVAADPAVFSVVTRDVAGNLSTPATVTFTIKNASILLVDDYLWLDSFGNVDRAKEREQRNFYREALRGYAFAEWDIAAQGMPDSVSILNYSSIVFASDSHVGDASDTWWTQVGNAGGGVMRHYMNNGGHLLAAGANILQWIYNTNPPSAGDFEYDYFGLDTLGGWDFWADFTWAIKDTLAPFDLPDSMKLDVAKNEDQVDYAEDIFGFRPGVTTLFVKGLAVDGSEPEDYGVSVGHIFRPDGINARGAMLNFDAFSMPLPGIRQTFHTILQQFGEGAGL